MKVSQGDVERTIAASVPQTWEYMDKRRTPRVPVPKRLQRKDAEMQRRKGNAFCLLVGGESFHDCTGCITV